MKAAAALHYRLTTESAPGGPTNEDTGSMSKLFRTITTGGAHRNGL